MRGGTGVKCSHRVEGKYIGIPVHVLIFSAHQCTIQHACTAALVTVIAAQLLATESACGTVA